MSIFLVLSSIVMSAFVFISISSFYIKNPIIYYFIGGLSILARTGNIILITYLNLNPE
jgi:hypothetical protein